jgi:hypothetical protein
MACGRVMMRRLVVAGLFAVMSASAPQAQAQNGRDHDHGAKSYQRNALVKAVRESTERFKDVRVAEAEGYTLMFGCVSGPDSGAMGLHYVKPELLGDDVVDAATPEIVIYEPLPNGGRRLLGADFLVFKEPWDATHDGAPELMGQLFHLFEAPNRFKIDAFYTLHVWAWKESPTGTFVNWHENVSCDAFNPQ